VVAPSIAPARSQAANTVKEDQVAKRKRPSPRNIHWKNIYPKSRSIAESPEFKALSSGAQVLYDVLCRLRYVMRNTDDDNSFWRTDLVLMRDSGMSRNALKRARTELIKEQFILVKHNSNHAPPLYYILDNVHKAPHDKDALKKSWQEFFDDDDEPTPSEGDQLWPQSP
jgi:hypothetical protein